MSDQANQPSFAIQRIYLKDLSLEQPNSPQVLLENAQPQVDINLTLAAELDCPFATPIAHMTRHVFDNEGRVRLFSSYGTDAATIAADINTLLSSP